MKKDCIEITGITPYDHFPECPCHYPSGQICETDKMCIPRKKPDIECICQVFADVSVSSYKIIRTPVGKKLVIEGMKHIKLLYVGDEPCQNMHCAHYDIPFCMFVLLKNWEGQIVDIFTGIEHIGIHELDSRCFTVSIIIFACPIFKKKHDCCYDYGQCNAHVNCDVHVNCYTNTLKNCGDSSNQYFHRSCEYGC
ncbi:MAG: DUF3794 domain-containing protein [Marinisporobacter sp.]|jgi:hypothetical protein|nr:DUF3794 domain-containing protein [Marinisporobacter sp.]